MRKIILASATVLALGACTSAQLQTAQNDISTGIQAACKDVQAVAALNPGSPVGSYATASCGTAAAVSSLVQNSGTLVWLGQLQAQLSAKDSAAKSDSPAVKM